MRLTLFTLASALTLSASATVWAADPQSTTLSAAPEPMAQPTAALPAPVSTESQGSAAAQQVSTEGEKLICHHPVHEGTILPGEVCLTKHAWDLIRLREQKNVEDFQRRGFQIGTMPD